MSTPTIPDLPGLPKPTSLAQEPEAPRTEVRAGFVYENEIPLLEEVYEHGGRPGEVYAFVTFERVYDCQEAGFRQVDGSPTFRIVGPKGEADCIWMHHIAYQPIQGLRPQMGRRLAFYDETITTKTGVKPGGEVVLSNPKKKPLPEPDSYESLLPLEKGER